MPETIITSLRIEEEAEELSGPPAQAFSTSHLSIFSVARLTIVALAQGRTEANFVSISSPGWKLLQEPLDGDAEQTANNSCSRALPFPP